MATTLETAIVQETPLSARREQINRTDAVEDLQRSQHVPNQTIGLSRAIAIGREALNQSNLSCLMLLSLAAFISAAADRMLQIKLGSISVFVAPTADNLGTGLAYMLLPLALLLVPIAIYFNDSDKRLRYLQGAMLIKALLAAILSLDLSRQFLTQGNHLVGYCLSLIFLAGEWTVICMVLYLSQRAPRPLIYLAVLGACYFGGQTAALVLAPYVVSRPFSNTFAAAISVTYLLAFLAARLCQNLKFANTQRYSHENLVAAPLENHSQSGGKTQHHSASGFGRLLAATVILYTPLYLGLLLPLFYALQGYQVGTLTFAALAAKGGVAFAIGAAASIFLHHLGSRRRVLQIVAVATVALASYGSLSYSYDSSLFTLLAVQTLAGFITPDWENHLLSVLPPRALAPFFAARNTFVMVLIALLSPAVERSLAAVSALYVLKELNILVLGVAAAAMVAAPILLGRKVFTPAVKSH